MTVFYEGTGFEGRSSLRKVRLETGEVVQRIDLAPEFFGEGITLLKNEVIQLTWQSQTGFVYYRERLPFAAAIFLLREGWGLATDGHEIFMSDGTPEIRVLDPETLAREAAFYSPRWDYIAVKELNELEFVDGETFCQRLADGSNRPDLSAER